MIYYKIVNGYEVTVHGHANYEEEGKDIVCASVSTAIILTSNLIERFNDLSLVEIKLDEGDFYLKPKKLNDRLKVLIDNLIWTLSELEKQYPDYIKRSDFNV